MRYFIGAGCVIVVLILAVVLAVVLDKNDPFKEEE